MSPYVRTVKTASGATAVQVVFGEHAGKKTLRHVGSAHDEHELSLLKAQAQRIIDGDQLVLDLPLGGLGTALGGSGSKDNPLPVTGQKAGYLLDCIDACYQRLGLDVATGDDQVFLDLVRGNPVPVLGSSRRCWSGKFHSLRCHDLVFRN